MSRLIDADKAKEVLTKLLYETALNNSGGASLMCEDIAENRLETWFGLVPTVDAEPVKHGQWISVTEQLLEINGRYLVTRGLNACGSLWKITYIANYSDLMGLKSKKIWWQGNVGKSDFERLDDVVAWMPLPKPYKGERREDG